MAVTVSRYNHTWQWLTLRSLADEADNLYFMLVDGTTAFSATHTTLAAATDAGADEIDGNGWTEGGEPLANVAVTIVETNETMIDCDDVGVTAVGGSIAAPAGIIYCNEGGAGTTKTPLWHYDFGETITAVAGVDFEITIPADGLHRWVNPA